MLSGLCWILINGIDFRHYMPTAGILSNARAVLHIADRGICREADLGDDTRDGGFSDCHTINIISF
jgi:hypothetical protein